MGYKGAQFGLVIYTLAGRQAIEATREGVQGVEGRTRVNGVWRWAVGYRVVGSKLWAWDVPHGIHPSRRAGAGGCRVSEERGREHGRVVRCVAGCRELSVLTMA